MTASAIAGSVLVAAVAAMTSPPSRQYFYMGSPPVADDEEVMVSFLGVRAGDPGTPLPTEPMSIAVPSSVSMELWLYRRIDYPDDGGSAPTPGEMTPTGTSFMDESIAVYNAVLSSLLGMGGCSAVFVRSGVSRRNGGLASFQLPFEVSL